MVRQIWRPVQRLTKISLNTPSSSFALQTEHNSAMYAWAVDNCRRRHGEILVAGHTHKPVFLAQSRLTSVAEDMAKARVAAAQGDVDAVERIPSLAAEEAWIRGKADEGDRFAKQGVGPRRPVYFNTGCCCFADGSVTGLEIAAGEIRLVRWPDNLYIARHRSPWRICRCPH